MRSHLKPHYIRTTGPNCSPNSPMMADTEERKQPPAVGYPAPSLPAAGMAHPYVAAPPPYYHLPPPPPQPYYNLYFNSGPNAFSPRQRFVRLVITASIVFFLVTGITTLIFWLVFRPVLPTFAVSSANAANLKVSSASNATDSPSLLSGDFVFTLNVRNPNEKMYVDYDKVGAAIGYGSDVISVISLPPFRLKKRSDAILRPMFAARNQYVSADSADAILMEKSGNADGVEFRLKVFARVAIRSRNWMTRRKDMRVYCDHIRIKFGNSTSGSMVGSANKCRVLM